MNRGHAIRQFMWAYQPHFRTSLRSTARKSFEAVGFNVKTEVLLIGFRVAGEHEFDICIEPETGPYEPSNFENVVEQARSLYQAHPDRDLIHSDRTIHEIHHRTLLDQMRAHAVAEVLNERRADQGLEYFVGNSTRVENFEVHVAIGVDRLALDVVPRINTIRRDRFRIAPSLVHAMIDILLGRANGALSHPRPGAGFSVIEASPMELARSAANKFINAVLFMADQWLSQDMDVDFNAICALPYEGRSSTGSLIFAKRNEASIRVNLRLKSAVRLREVHAIRKMLEATGPAGNLLVDSDGCVYGVGQVAPDYNPGTESIFHVHMKGRGAWDVLHDGKVLMSVRDSQPALPQAELDTDRLADRISRLIPGANTDAIVQVARSMADNKHGAMLVVSADAEGEATRLSPQVWGIEPTRLEDELAAQITNMDGALLVDSQGMCHAIGVILDGKAAGRGNPARGSRFNNALRYLDSNPPPTVVIVYSSDGAIDVLPDLMPQLYRNTVAEAYETYLRLAVVPPLSFEKTAEAWDDLRRFEFYLTEEQCARVNHAHKRLNDWVLAQSGGIVIEGELVPDDSMNDSYWLD